MAASNTTKTKPSTKATAVDEAAAVADAKVEEDMNKETEKTEEKKTAGRPKAKTVKTKEVQEEPLNDSDEIEVMAVIPNVSYEDFATSNYYEWNEAGQIESMPFGTIRAMHRKYKSYFGDMWLKPLDDRVIKKLGLSRVYDKYDAIMDESNYTIDKVDEVLNIFSSASNGLKMAAVNKVKDMVFEGIISDARVIKKLEDKLNIELLSFL